MVANTVIESSAAAATLEEGAIDRCGSCGTRIALRFPIHGSPASTWLCRRCGSVYFARCQEREGQPFSPATSQVSYVEVMKAIYNNIEGDDCPIPQRYVQRAVESASVSRHAGREARKQKRYPAAAAVTAVPLAADFRVAARPARITTINLSGGGVALLHMRRIAEPYLVIDFAASGINLLPAILQVTRVRPLPGAFEVAGRFISRIVQE